MDIRTTKYVIPTTIVKKFDANAPVNLGPRVGLKVVVRSANIRERKARLKRHQKVRWDRQIGLKKYAASAAIKKLVGSKKNLGSENRTQKTIHRRPQQGKSGVKEKFGVRQSDSKIKQRLISWLFKVAIYLTPNNISTYCEAENSFC